MTKSGPIRFKSPTTIRIIPQSTNPCEEVFLDPYAVSSLLQFTPKEYPYGIILEICDDKGYSTHYVHWDFHVNAPISPILLREAMILYIADNDLRWPNDHPNANHLKAPLVNIIDHNQAGRNGEHLEWLEILKLYEDKR